MEELFTWTLWLKSHNPHRLLSRSVVFWTPSRLRARYHALMHSAWSNMTKGRRQLNEQHRSEAHEAGIQALRFHGVVKNLMAESRQAGYFDGRPFPLHTAWYWRSETSFVLYKIYSCLLSLPNFGQLNSHVLPSSNGAVAFPFCYSPCCQSLLSNLRLHEHRGMPLRLADRAIEIGI